MTENEKEQKPRRSLRTIAFLGVVCSTCAIAACLISFPLVFQYVQTLQASIQADLEFCRGRSRDMWKEVLEVQQTTGASAHRMAKAIDLLREADPTVQIDYESLSRVARKAPVRRVVGKGIQLRTRNGTKYNRTRASNVNLFVHAAPQESQVINEREAPISPNPNPPGVVPPSASTTQAPTTSAGNVNPRGPAEPVGRRVEPAPRPAQPVPIQLPTSSVGQSFSSGGGPGTCCTCHRGPPGPAGNPGNDGRDGMDGEDGRPGENGPPATQVVNPESLFPKQCPCEADKGEPGPAGPAGARGPEGPSGPPGDDGKGGDNGLRGEIGKTGPDGKSGDKGPPGDEGVIIPSKEIPAGKPGNPGKDGAAGPLGEQGKPGNPGKDGDNGLRGEPGPQGQPGGKGKEGDNGLRGQGGDRGSCLHCPPPRLAPGY